jgi:hypothetical protein
VLDFRGTFDVAREGVESRKIAYLGLIWDHSVFLLSNSTCLHIHLETDHRKIL